MSDIAIQRRIALGVYPQREDKKPGFLERIGETLFRGPVEFFNGSTTPAGKCVTKTLWN